MDEGHEEHGGTLRVPSVRGVSRRDFVAAAAGAMTLGGLLAACGNESDGTTSASAASSAAPATVAADESTGGAASSGGGALGGDRKSQKYYWITANLADPFYVDGIAGMNEFAGLFGVSVEVVGPQENDAAGMTKAFEEVLAKPDVTGIFSYYYADFAAAKPLYEQAAEKGIPIVNGAGDWGPPRLAFCGVQDQDAPNVAVDTLGNALGGKGKIGFIGNTGVNLIREEEFFEQFVKERFPDLEYVGNATHDGSAEDALKQYQAFIQAKSPDAMFFGDGLGPGIVDGLVSAGPDIKLMLRGFGENGLKAIKDGRVLASCDRSTFDEEFWGFMPLFWAVNGNFRGPDKLIVPTVLVDSTNIDAFMSDPHHNTSAKINQAA